MSWVGMDVDAVRQVARDLQRHAATLDDICRRVDAPVSQLPNHWAGADATRFVSSWRQEHRPRLQALAKALADLSRSAAANADEQERVSATSGSPVGTTTQRSEMPFREQQSEAWLKGLPTTTESWETSLQLANPHYGDFSQDLSTFYAELGLLDSSGEYRNNCGYASIAYDMRRRGYDVVAQPDLDGDLTSSLASAYRDPETGLDGQWTDTGDERSTVESMSDYGPGSRAIVFVRWTGNTGGHFFIAENHDGQVVFLDPQNNEANVASYFGRIEPGTVRILRTDDLEPNMNPMKYMMVTEDGE